LYQQGVPAGKKKKKSKMRSRTVPEVLFEGYVPADLSEPEIRRPADGDPRAVSSAENSVTT
jgi:hypothetical protein